MMIVQVIAADNDDENAKDLNQEKEAISQLADEELNGSQQDISSDGAAAGAVIADAASGAAATDTDAVNVAGADAVSNPNDDSAQVFFILMKLY